MADRYWVGGAGTWDTTITTNWSTSSGGAGGASAPTSADNVIIDSASGTGVLTPLAGVCADLTVTSTTNITFGKLLGSTLSIFGSLNTFKDLPTTIIFSATTTGKTITTNGALLSATYNSVFAGVGGGWTFLDAVTFGGIIFFQAGSLNTNNFNFTLASLISQTSNAKSITLGTSLVTFTGANGTWNISGGSNWTSVSAASSTIKLGNNPGAAAQTFGGRGQTYGTVEIPGTGNNVITFTGSNTINSLVLSRTSAYTIKFTDGTTNTIGSITGGGSSGNVITITSTTGTAQATLTKSGGGTIVVPYTDISWINATPTTTWYATNSTDSGNNTGWTFGSPPLNVTLTAGGTVVFSGNAGISKARILSAGGTVVFSGASVINRQRTLAPSGTVTFSGVVSALKTKILSAGGTVTFSGTSPISSGATHTYTLTAGGTVNLSGSAIYAKTKTQYPSGGIVFSGTAVRSRSKLFSASGTVVFSGTVIQIKTKNALPSGTVNFSGSSAISFIPSNAPTGSQYNRLSVGIARSIRLS